MMRDSVLIVERDAEERRRITAILGEAGFQVTEVASIIQGMVDLIEVEPALIVLAEEIDPLRPYEVVRVVHRLTGAPVMVIGSGGMAKEVDVLMRGGDFYLGRRFTAAELVSRARMLVRRGEACWQGMETGLWAGQPPRVNGGVRPIDMGALRWDREWFMKGTGAAS